MCECGVAEDNQVVLGLGHSSWVGLVSVRDLLSFFSVSGFTRVCHHTWHIYVGSEDLTQASTVLIEPFCQLSFILRPIHEQRPEGSLQVLCLYGIWMLISVT